MRISAVLFDLDGTLLDTLEDLYLTVNEAFRNNGFPERTRDEVRLSTGHGAAYLLRSLLPDSVSDAEAECILEEYKPLLQKNQNNNTRPYDGIIEMLVELKNSGVTSAILSNKPHEVVSGLTDIYFKDSVAACLGDKPDVPRKPDPEGARIVLNMIGKSSEETVYAGDSEIDIKTAKNLGVPSIGVTWGFRDRDVLERAGADYIVDTPEELAEIISELNNRR